MFTSMKLSSDTLPTKRQGELFTAAGAGSQNITLRGLSKPGFEQDDKLTIIGVFKTNGNGTVSNFHDIKKNQI